MLILQEIYIQIYINNIKDPQFLIFLQKILYCKEKIKNKND